MGVRCNSILSTEVVCTMVVTDVEEAMDLRTITDDVVVGSKVTWTLYVTACFGGIRRDKIR